MNTINIVRGCGCVMEMPVKEGGSAEHLAAKRARWERTRCPTCGEKFSREHNQAQGTNKPIKKGSEVKLLPVGTHIVLLRTEDGWFGTIGVNNVPVTELKAAGLMSVISKLARKWCVQAGAKVTGKVD